MSALSGSREPSQSAVSRPEGFDPERLRELAARCEKATGPDRELDAEIDIAVRGFPERAYSQANGLRTKGSPQLDRIKWFISWGAAKYTASLDAAMELIPDNLHLAQFGEARFMTRSPCFSASLEQWVDEHLEARTPFRCHGVALTPALAICAAALRACAAQGTEAQRAETENTGSVHDGPVPKGCAQTPPSNPNEDGL